MIPHPLSVGDAAMIQDFGLDRVTTPAFRTADKMHWMPQDVSALQLITACAQNPSRCQVADVPH